MAYVPKNKMDLSFLRVFLPKIDTPWIIFMFCTFITIITSIFFIAYIFYSAMPIFETNGINFILGSTWDYTNGVYGILPLIVGTVSLTILTMIIACPISIFTAIYLAEFSPNYISKIMRPMIELLVGIPSVVYGIFGFFILRDVLNQYVNPFINNTLGFIPIFRNIHSDGTGLLLGSTVLAIMVLPTITALSEVSIRAVSRENREASFALGANHWETVKKLVIPSALPGILTGIILAIMRAMGETMAVVMLVGNSWRIPSSVLDYAYPMTAKIVNDIPYWVAFDGPRSALLGIAAVLFLLELLFIVIVRTIGGTKKWE